VPGVEENLEVWSQGWDWSDAGEEWSGWWGGTPALWFGALLPRIHAFLPTGTILEIAPGYGRWTQYLRDMCERLVAVDLTERCIEYCRKRFSQATNLEFHVNDGRSLAMIEDESVDFVFSFDSLVHVDEDVLASYLNQLATKLRPNGVGFFHHSNLGSYRMAKRMTIAAARHVIPQRFVKPLVEKGVLVNLGAWRAENVTAKRFVELCDAAGLACIGQEMVSWEHGSYKIDTLSTFTRRGSVWERPLRVVSNPGFRREGARMARCYSRNSFPRAGEGTGIGQQ
jgi:2-polyprenyl-3-methyl-5-hydroxy-6-metoxy-1,4-benzoquinol methylase